MSDSNLGLSNAFCLPVSVLNSGSGREHSRGLRSTSFLGISENSYRGQVTVPVYGGTCGVSLVYLELDLGWSNEI